MPPDHDEKQQRLQARRQDMEKHEALIISTPESLDTLLRQANSSRMMRVQVSLSPWQLRGLVNAMRDRNLRIADLERQLRDCNE